MAILGLRGTGSWSADERPESWREMILFVEEARADAPLTALLSKLDSEPTSDPHFHWFDEQIHEYAVTASAAFLATDTVITINDATVVKVGDILMNMRTLEKMRVTAVNVSANQITVTRAFGTTAAAAGNAGDKLLCIGSAYGEGTGAPTAISFNPNARVNYCQIFKESIFLTGTAMKTALRTGDPLANDRARALRRIAIKMERAFIFGEPKLATDANGQPLRTTAGLLYFIPAGNVVDFSAGVTEKAWDEALEKIFTYGNNEKLALCGPRALTTVTRMAKLRGTINLVPTDQTYGLRLAEYISAHGTLYLLRHPLFAKTPELSGNMLIVDPPFLVYRYLEGRDLSLLENVQAPDVDARMDLFIAECGLEVRTGLVHAYFTNITNYAGSG